MTRRQATGADSDGSIVMIQSIWSRLSLSVGVGAAGYSVGGTHALCKVLPGSASAAPLAVSTQLHGTTRYRLNPVDTRCKGDGGVDGGDDDGDHDGSGDKVEWAKQPEATGIDAASSMG